jgi:drug/metabolite transporter (DMT)-like permease
MNPKIKAHLLLSFMALVGGANYIIAKNVVPFYIGASGMIVIRVFTATILFIILDYFSKDKREIVKDDYWKIIACAFTGVVINQLFFFNGLAITSPINASLMMLVSPIVIMVFAVIILKEKVYWFNGLGIILGVTGALLLIFSNNNLSTYKGSNLGDLYIFINAISWGLYVILAAPLMQKYNPFKLLKWTFGIGFIFVLPVGFRQFMLINIDSFTGIVWASFTFVLVFATYIAYYIHTAVLKYISPSISGVYVYFQPLIAAIIAVTFGVDTFTYLKVFAGLLIFIGVFLVGNKK